MINQKLPGLPEIVIEEWDTLAVPREELQAVLAYLAHRTGRSVRMKVLSGELYYSSDAIMVYPYPDGAEPRREQDTLVEVSGQEYALDQVQRAYNPLDDPEEPIVDENGLLLAIVEHNCIVLHVDLLALDNPAARNGLSYIVEKAIPLLNFNVERLAKKQLESVKTQLAAFYSAAISARLGQKKNELQNTDRDIENAYYSIIDAERKKPLLTAEIEMLERMAKAHPASIAAQQAKSLQELKQGGHYEEIRCLPDGAVSAKTGNIVIQYDGWDFPVGRYMVEISREGDLRIRNLDPHPDAQHPHPHVGTDHRACLGNISGDLAKMIGKMRIAEALQVIHQFLCSYNPENPYERISHFDPNGEYQDDDDDPCHDCDEKFTGYCIFECGSNDGQFGCSDCNDYRTTYCFTDCPHNHDFQSVHPCDRCTDEATQHCYLECEYNQEWELRNPCTSCDHETCQDDCEFKERKEGIDHAKAGTTQQAS
jgi:hypothetical protein